ncbi:unnamed protein product, partial [Ostreobium quekettii]
MGSGDTSFWENGFMGMPALEAFFGGQWSHPREFLSNSMKELLIIPAKKTMSDIVRCIDLKFRTTSEGWNGEEANSRQQAIEKKKCLGINQLQAQTSGVLGRSFSAGDGQGSPWAIQAVHIGSDEAESDDATSEQTDSTELTDQHMHLSSVTSAEESEIVATFKSVGNPLSSDVAEEEAESAGFVAVDNPMFDSSSIESDCDCSDRISNDDVKNYDVWENPEFLESISEVDRTLEEGQSPVTTLMTENPLFQEGFADKRATSLSNPLFENDSDVDCDDTACSTASYSDSDTNALRAEIPVMGWKVGQVGLFDSASELLDALARAESGASTQRWGWHGYDIDSEPPTPKLRNSSSDQGHISLTILVPQESCVVSMDPGWISIGDAGRAGIDGIDSKPSKPMRRTCLGALTRKNLADLSAKICCRVVCLIDCLLSMCQSCFPPVVGDYLPGSEYVMGL